MELVLSTNWENPNARRREAMAAVTDELDKDKLLELVFAYLRTWGKKRAKTSRQTVKTYETGISNFLGHIWAEGESPDPHPLRLTSDDVARWIAKLQDEGKEPKTIQTYVASARTLYKALIWAGAMRGDPFEVITVQGDPTRAVDKHPPIPGSYYDAMVSGLFEEEDGVPRRDLCIVLLFGDAGFRIGDIVRANASDIDLRLGVAEIKGGKGGKSAEQPLSPDCVQALTSYLLGVRNEHAREGERALFVNFGKKVRDDYRGKRMGEDGVRGVLKRLYEKHEVPVKFRRSHALRKRAGTDYQAAVGDINLTRDFLRQSDPATTLIYIETSEASKRSGLDAMSELRRRRREKG